MELRNNVAIALLEKAIPVKLAPNHLSVIGASDFHQVTIHLDFQSNEVKMTKHWLTYRCPMSDEDEDEITIIKTSNCNEIANVILDALKSFTKFN